MSVRRHPAVGPTGAAGSPGSVGATGATGPAGTAPAGVPILRGPYVVDFSDIPHDGDTLTLWTPAAGDVLLRLFADTQDAVPWDRGVPVVRGLGGGAPALAAARHDTFARPDQSGWGTASDGHAWAAFGGYATEAITSGSGAQTIDGGYDADVALLGDALPGTDYEMLVRWSVQTEGTVVGGDGPTTDCGAGLVVHAAADATSYACITMRLDGQASLETYGAAGLGLRRVMRATPGASGAVGDYFHTRLHVQGYSYSWRTWLDGTPEPTAWDHVVCTDAIPAFGCVGLTTAFNTVHAGQITAYDHFSATAWLSLDNHISPSSDPVLVQLVQPTGSDPTAGHVEIYAVVARAVAP